MPKRTTTSAVERLEPNGNGGATLVATQVPPNVNNMDFLADYFTTFGDVVGLWINRYRHEAVISFARVEDAERALGLHVLDDLSIGLRPWQTKKGKRDPHEVPSLTAVSSSVHVIATPAQVTHATSAATDSDMVPAPVASTAASIGAQQDEAIAKKKEIKEQLEKMIVEVGSSVSLCVERIFNLETCENEKKDQLVILRTKLAERLQNLIAQRDALKKKRKCDHIPRHIRDACVPRHLVVTDIYETEDRGQSVETADERSSTGNDLVEDVLETGAIKKILATDSEIIPAPVASTAASIHAQEDEAIAKNMEIRDQVEKLIVDVGSSVSLCVEKIFKLETCEHEKRDQLVVLRTKLAERLQILIAQRDALKKKRKCDHTPRHIRDARVPRHLLFTDIYETEDRGQSAEMVDERSDTGNAVVEDVLETRAMKETKTWQK